MLPRDRILLRGSAISIFDYSQISEGAVAANPTPAVSLTNSIDAIVHRNTLQMIVEAGDDRFVCWDDGGICGLVLGREAILGEQLVKRCSLMKWPLWILPNASIKAHFSYNCGLLGGEESLFFVRYAWPGEGDNEEPPGISQRRFRGMGLSSSLQMSLFSGKIVCLDNFWRISISDVL